MPVYDGITYSFHARRRMQKRGISPQDVELVLRFGDGQQEEDGTWIYELERIQVVIAERETTAHVVTVIRLRKHT